MSKKCLYCYKAIRISEGDFHEACSLVFFGTKTAPVLEYSFNQMAKLAKNVVERSIAVPGVQPKLSLSFVSEVMDNGAEGRLTVVGALGGNYIFKPPSENYREMPQNEHVTAPKKNAGGSISFLPTSCPYRESYYIYVGKKEYSISATNKHLYV